MIESGLVEEVRGLVARGYSWDLPAMSSLGYREFEPYLGGAATLGQAVERLKFNTHAFARRQPGWFRRLPQATQLPADHPALIERALAAWPGNNIK